MPRAMPRPTRNATSSAPTPCARFVRRSLAAIEAILLTSAGPRRRTSCGRPMTSGTSRNTPLRADLLVLQKTGPRWQASRVLIWRRPQPRGKPTDANPMSSASSPGSEQSGRHDRIHLSESPGHPPATCFSSRPAPMTRRPRSAHDLMHGTTLASVGHDSRVGGNNHAYGSNYMFRTMLFQRTCELRESWKPVTASFRMGLARYRGADAVLGGRDIVPVTPPIRPLASP